MNGYNLRTGCDVTLCSISPFSSPGSCPSLTGHSRRHGFPQLNELQPREQSPVLHSSWAPTAYMPWDLLQSLLIRSHVKKEARSDRGCKEASVSSQIHGVQKTHFQRESGIIDHQAAGVAQPDAHHTGRPRDTVVTKKPVSKSTCRFHPHKSLGHTWTILPKQESPRSQESGSREIRDRTWDQTFKGAPLKLNSCQAPSYTAYQWTKGLKHEPVGDISILHHTFLHMVPQRLTDISQNAKCFNSPNTVPKSKISLEAQGKLLSDDSR